MHYYLLFRPMFPFLSINEYFGNITAHVLAYFPTLQYKIHNNTQTTCFYSLFILWSLVLNGNTHLHKCQYLYWVMPNLQSWVADGIAKCSNIINHKFSSTFIFRLQKWDKFFKNTISALSAECFVYSASVEPTFRPLNFHEINTLFPEKI